MLKAARASRGDGHLFGDELSAEEWEAVLVRMQDPTIRADRTSYVLQPLCAAAKVRYCCRKRIEQWPIVKWLAHIIL
jgi:hypothetical protein